MLVLNIPEKEFFNEQTNEFVYVQKQTVKLEHSLISVSKWEAKWNKAFLGKQKKTNEEILDYIRCMLIDSKNDSWITTGLSSDIVSQITDYINKPMTACFFSDDDKSNNRQTDTITSEIIYYWMISHNIPFECEKWHLNRLLALIRVCSIKNNQNGKRKMSKSSIISRNQALNAERRAKLKSKG